ncbi:MAG TPA: response regulator [Sphaerochaeta sp.]|nr:response regulator [Sphaerochaeta sp.]
MITIMIVDDEKTTRQIISRYLNSTQIYRVIGEANDGIEALDLLESEQPDVLITDICMPRMDGLELVKQIRALQYTTNVILMSGHSDFDYAKQAIKYNVEEYLLKPFMPSTLEETLNTIKNKIEVNRYKGEDKENISTNFLNSMVKGELDTVEILKGIEALQLPIGGNSFLIGFLRIYSQDPEVQNFDKKRAWDYFQNILGTVLPPCLNAVCFMQPKDRSSILFSFKGCQQEVCREELSKLFVQLSKALNQECKVSVWCGFSPCFNSLAQSSEANTKAEMVWKKHSTLTEPCNFYQEPVTDQGGKETLLKEIQGIENDCALTISLGDMTSLHNLDSLFICMEELACHSYHTMQVNLLSFVIRISNLVDTAGMNKETREDFNHYLNDAKAIGSLFETKHLLKEAICTALAAKRYEKKSVSDIIVSSVKQKVSSNVSNEKFTVEEAIEGLNYSNNYIRHIFTQTEGMSIKEYIITERMLLAKHLLENSDMPIKEIAERTGHHNQHYFSSSFKKYVGSSPSEWRESN